MATEIAENIGMINKLDLALHEKNVFNDQLQKIELKTGVRRLYIVLGKSNYEL